MSQVHPPVVVLGATGMLGHKVFQLLRQRFPGTLATARQDVATSPFRDVALLQGPDVVWRVDVMDFDHLRERLEAWAPGVVVNCVGLIKQRDEASDPVRSITVNALLPHRLAEVARGWGGRLIHFSTDCVFSGRTGSYREADPSDADDLYGKSKRLGEVAAPNAVTLRTSVIGRELARHRSLLDWFLAQNGRRVRGYRRVIYSGITTNEMARVVAMVIAEHPGLSGVFQVAAEPIAKYDLLGLLRSAYRLQVEIDPDDAERSDRSMRPDRFREATGWRAPGWPEMVAALAADPTPYGAWGVSVLTGDQRV